MTNPNKARNFECDGCPFNNRALGETVLVCSEVAAAMRSKLPSHFDTPPGSNMEEMVTRLTQSSSSVHPGVRKAVDAGAEQCSELRSSLVPTK